MNARHAIDTAELLRRHARERPDVVAVHFPTHGPRRAAWDSLTFAELDARADACARGFSRAGLGRGDRVVLAVKPSMRFYEVVFGLWRAGAIPVFVDPGMGRQNALRCIETIAPRGMVAASAAHAVSKLVRKPFRSVEVRVTDGPRLFWGGTTLAGCVATPGSGAPEVPDADPSDEAVIVFTSGSTGAPKAVSLPHATMRARTEYVQQMFGLEAGDVIVETLLVYTILEILMGLTVAVPQMDVAKPAKVDPAHVVDAVRRFKPRVASASPVVWQKLMRHCQAAKIRLDGLETLLTTAAPIPVDLHQRLADVVPATTELFTPYGATEALPVALIGTAAILADTGAKTSEGAGTCVGPLAPGIAVRIVRLTDDPMPTWRPEDEMAPGELGEITVAGAGVSPTYRESPEGNAAAKIDDEGVSWHRMGDLGYVDPEGRLWFCGRKSHRLETEAGVIPAVPVEGVYNRHPKVMRTALVGIGPYGAQRAVLCVELEPGETWTEELAAEIRAGADGTRWQGVVTRLLHHPGFPTDTRHNSKIRREDLAGWAAAR